MATTAKKAASKKAPAKKTAAKKTPAKKSRPGGSGPKARIEASLTAMSELVADVSAEFSDAEGSVTAANRKLAAITKALEGLVAIVAASTEIQVPNPLAGPPPTITVLRTGS